MAITMSPTREKFPLSSKKPVKKTLAVTIGWIIFFIILLGIALPFGWLWNNTPQSFHIPSTWFLFCGLGAVILLVLITGLQYFYQILYFNSYYYDLNDSFIVIRKGVITPREISIPYERVQDIYVDQDLWDRIFHLYDVHLSTATWTSGMEAHIDGVEKQAADGLRETLLKTIGEKIHKKPTATIQTQGDSTKS